MGVKTGYLRGTGAAINVELGWIPDKVTIINETDGDKVWVNTLKKKMVFSSGSTAPVAGDKLTGQTSGATGTVLEVLLDTGSWAGADAAGWIILDPSTISGTFQSEAVEVNDSGTGDDLTGAAIDQDGIDIDTEVAATTTAATNIIAYVGSSGANALGFTVGSTISEDAKLLSYEAVRDDMGGPVNNSA